MDYRFEKLYVGTLAENEQENMSHCVVYQGDILCTKGKNNVLVDIINGGSYDYADFSSHKEVPNGRLYVYGLSEDLPQEFGYNIISRKKLIRLAEKLNETGSCIKIPENEKVKVKRMR